MMCGDFTHDSAYRTSMPIPGTGDYRMIVSLCTGGAYPSICTDIIALFALYCQHLFLSLFYPPFKGDYVEGLSLSLDRYLIRLSCGVVNYFFASFLLFSTFFHIVTCSLTPIGDVITITIIDMNRNENHFHYY
nr:MAG TPA: hypothetical protein [Caudoviricetes sp.]